LNTKPGGCERWALRCIWIRPVIPDLPFCSAAASCFINIVIKESDNNVKLIVIDRLDTLRSKHGHILDGLIMDVLQVLSRSVFVFCCTPFADGDHVIQCRYGSSAEGNEHRPEYDL
jgi:vesicle coat complex subunit